MKPPNRTTFAVEVEPDDSVSTFKAKIEEREGYKRNQQRLVYCGRDLKDHELVGSYGLESGSAVLLNLRVLGGHGVDTESAHASAPPAAQVADAP